MEYDDTRESIDPTDGKNDELTAPTDEAAPEAELSARDLPAAEPTPLDVRDVRLADIFELPNIRPDVHGIDYLADSMHVQGQLEPVLVRPAPETATHGKPFELVFGNRRKHAAEVLEWETIRAEVRGVPDERRRQVALIENFHRSPMSSVAEARAFYDLKFSSEPPLTNREVANQLGIDPSQVSHRLSMLIKLAPAQPAPQLPPTPATPAEGQDVDEDAPAPNLPAVIKPSAHQPVRNEHGQLVLPGEALPATADENSDEPGQDAAVKPKLDILALVDEGRISGSVAEVIASLDQRDEQEKLTSLVLKYDWGVKKASEWARAAKKHDVEGVTDAEQGLGAVEMLEMVDVTPLQTLRVRADITEEQVNRVILYSQLRNGMDQEILEYLYETVGFSFETLWDYVALLDDQQVNELKRRLALRYISSAHRFFDLEPTLKDELGVPEEELDEPAELADTALALPGHEAPASFGALPEASDLSNLEDESSYEDPFDDASDDEDESSDHAEPGVECFEDEESSE